MKQLFLTRAAALGNGSRQVGFVLCDFEGNLADAIAGARGTRKISKLGKFKLAEGVAEREVYTALLNGYVSFNDPLEPVEPVEQSPTPDSTESKIVIAELELSDEIKSALSKAGIATADDVSKFGEANNGLGSILPEAKDQEALFKVIGEAMKPDTSQL